MKITEQSLSDTIREWLNDNPERAFHIYMSAIILAEVPVRIQIEHLKKSFHLP